MKKNIYIFQVYFNNFNKRPFNWPEEDKPYWSLKCPSDDLELVKTKASYLWKKDNKLSDKTLCMNGVVGPNNEYNHFNTHNIYAYFENIPTYEAAKLIDNSRGFVITRSTFLGSGKYGGHWTGVKFTNIFFFRIQNAYVKNTQKVLICSSNLQF